MDVWTVFDSFEILFTAKGFHTLRIRVSLHYEKIYYLHLVMSYRGSTRSLFNFKVHSVRQRIEICIETVKNMGKIFILMLYLIPRESARLFFERNSRWIWKMLFRNS